MNRAKPTNSVSHAHPSRAERCTDYDVVSGIGHKIKSVNNPDLRVELVKEYVFKHFPSHSLLDYALAVEKVTTSKKDTLILNVDGCIAVCFVDLLRDSGAFTPEEADEYIKVSFDNLLLAFAAPNKYIAPDRYTQRSLRPWPIDWFHWPPPRSETSPCPSLPPPRRRYLHQHGRRLATKGVGQDLRGLFRTEDVTRILHAYHRRRNCFLNV